MILAPHRRSAMAMASNLMVKKMSRTALAAAIIASIVAPSSAFLLTPTSPLHSISRPVHGALASTPSVQRRLAIGRSRRIRGSALGLRSQVTFPAVESACIQLGMRVSLFYTD